MATPQETVDYDEMKNWLLEERKRLQEQIDDLGQDRARTIPPGEVGYGNHPADYGTEVFEQEKKLSLHRNAEEQLQQVDAALERIDQGAYGICSVCGRRIDPERLKALPYVTLCKDDAEQLGA